jgi:hypothetical protein
MRNAVRDPALLESGRRFFVALHCRNIELECSWPEPVL